MLTWLLGICICLALYSDPAPDGVFGNAGIRIKIPKSRGAASKAVIACSYLFVCSFAPTWGPGMWIYCSEIFPLRLRAKANGLTAASNWIFNWALALFVAPSFTNLTWKTYIIFICFCFTMTVHVFLLFPETKGKTLEEIDQIWEAKIPAWRTANFVIRQPSVTEIKQEMVMQQTEHEARSTAADAEEQVQPTEHEKPSVAPTSETHREDA